MRCRSVVGSLLAAGQLLFQRGKLCERRVRIGGTIALARGGARCVGTQRRSALAVAALVAVAATVVTIAGLALVAIAELALVVAIAILALEAAVLVVASLSLGTGCSIATTFARLAEVSAAIAASISAMTAAMTMTLLTALLAVGGLRCFAFGRRCTGLRTRLRARLIVVALVTMALVARLALVVTAAGTPDLDELWLGGRGRGLRRRSGIGRCGSFGCSSL
jgi:hypothetical protein